MPTADSVKTKLQGLIATANETTGGNDTTLTGAVNTLVGGYGQGGGDTSVEDGIITKLLTEYRNDRVTFLGGSVFANAAALTSVYLPNVETVSSAGFQFQNCTSLSSVYLPKLTQGRIALFSKCTALESVSLPSVKATGTRTFEFCTSLKNVDLPVMDGIDATVFAGCTALKEACFPSARTAYSNCFINCTALEKVEFGGQMNFLRPTVFKGCTSFKTLILRNSEMSVITNAQAFNDSPFAVGGTGGTVYVPAALVSEYQTATNWSTLYAAGTCNFVAIEGSEYE